MSSLPCGFYPYSESLLCYRDAPLSESQVRVSADRSNPHSEATVNPTLLLGFLHSKAKMFAGTTDGTTPFGNNTADLSNHFQDRPTIPVIKISTPKRCDHYYSKKPTVKQARQDLNKHFHSKEIYICFTLKSLSISNTFLQLHT